VLRERDKVGKRFPGNPTNRDIANKLLDLADQSSGSSIPKGKHHSPGTRLVHLKREWFNFFRLMESHLQRTYLTAAVALEHSSDLFAWIARELPNDYHLRTLWAAVIRDGEKCLATAIPAEVSVRVLQGVMNKYMLSKQRTWRVAKGLHVESTNQVALRTLLRAQALAAPSKQLAAREDAAGLVRGTLSSLLKGSHRLAPKEAVKLVQHARDAGAAVIAKDMARSHSVADAAEAAGAAGSTADALDNLVHSFHDGKLAAVHMYALVLLKADHGLTFTRVAGDASAKVCRIASIDSAAGRTITLAPAGRSAQVGDYVLDVTSRRQGGTDRSTNPAVLVDDKRKPQYPLTLIILSQTAAFLQGASTAVAAAGLARTGRGDGVGEPAHRPRSKAGATGSGASAGAGTGAGAGVHAPPPSPAVPAGPTPARKSSKKRGLGADTPAGDDGAPPSPAIPAGHTPGRKSSKQRASSADHGGASGGAATPAGGASKKVTFQLPPAGAAAVPHTPARKRQKQ
jgi:hypothetical protein